MKRSDEDGFVEFVQASSPSLLRTAWLLTGNRHAAEELVQESLTRLYPKWHKVQHQQPLAYTRRILVNLHTSTWRKYHRESLSYTGDLPEGEPVDATGGSDNRDHVLRLLRELPPRERQVIVLRHYADLSERDVADMLGISIGTVKSAASHGLATLRAAHAGKETS